MTTWQEVNAGWEKDELRSAAEWSERHTPTDYWADRDRASDGARAEAEDQRRDR